MRDLHSGDLGFWLAAPTMARTPAHLHETADHSGERPDVVCAADEG
ncbi:hypothetical protein LAC81_11155 [Ensifer adhaerens]|nr:hypothetical protein [Ensifer adhaerens]MBZ7922343.1 hypothetical protein [Ensifer adhaerens]UAX90980.1 hypothetical protein LAC78_11150 [Ensifer adhaerens]UAX98609.1 hypothetical protein LAC80_11160 [Ensifer adhaerens]UAY05990.1 hypothetical protein LAC81_11155 [Ensifer adhaerens]